MSDFHRTTGRAECLCPKCSTRVYSDKAEAICPVRGSKVPMNVFSFDQNALQHANPFDFEVKNEGIWEKSKKAIREFLINLHYWTFKHKILSMLIGFVLMIFILRFVLRISGLDDSLGFLFWR